MITATVQNETKLCWVFGVFSFCGLFVLFMKTDDAAAGAAIVVGNAVLSSARLKLVTSPRYLGFFTMLLGEG